MTDYRYFLTEPHTQILGRVLSRREREVTRDEYAQAAEAAGYGEQFARWDTFSFWRYGEWLHDPGTRPRWRYRSEIAGRMESATPTERPLPPGHCSAYDSS